MALTVEFTQDATRQLGDINVGNDSRNAYRLALKTAIQAVYAPWAVTNPPANHLVTAAFPNGARAQATVIKILSEKVQVTNVRPV